MGNTLLADLKFCTGTVLGFSLLCMVGLGLGYYINYRPWAGSQSNSRDSVAVSDSRPSGRDKSGDPRGYPISIIMTLHYMGFGDWAKKFLG